MRNKEFGYDPLNNHGSIQSINADRYNDDNEVTHTYEHFPVVCPSCKGKGKICKDSSEMVTFVPVKDKRLKPARTKLKIFIMLVIIAISSGLATFFLYPRTVRIHVAAHSIINFRFLKHKAPWIQYSFDMSIENDYYLAITVKGVLINLLYQQQNVGTKKLSEPIHIGIRGVKKILVTMNVSYEGLQDQLWQQCYYDRDFLGQVISSSGELSYWMYHEHLASKQDYFYADCGSLVFPGDLTSTLTPNATTHAPHPTSSNVTLSTTSSKTTRFHPKSDIITYATKRTSRTLHHKKTTEKPSQPTSVVVNG